MSLKYYPVNVVMLPNGSTYFYQGKFPLKYEFFKSWAFEIEEGALNR